MTTTTLSPKQVSALRIVKRYGRGSVAMLHHATFDSLTRRGLIRGSEITVEGLAALAEVDA